MSTFIDRRLNDRHKSAANRQRFLRRYKDQIRRSLDTEVDQRKMGDFERGARVKLPARDISEPQFGFGRGGDREIVHPGNREFQTGDRIPRPPGGSGQGTGAGKPGPADDSVDEFLFTLSREEFMELFFDDLELPHLARTQLGAIHEMRPRRAGYARTGTPANLAVVRSLRNAMARRNAARAPLLRELEERRQGQAPAAEIDALEERIKRIPWVDEFDLRFVHHSMQPEPVTRAVMFCLMDVSASMDEHRKDLAKRFFTLLYLFLTRKYAAVELVFIRHTSDAEEVDENTFFHDPKSGGTVVHTALKLLGDIINARFSDGWNLYAAQASDGDAFGADIEKSRATLEKLLPRLRYFAYLEVGDAKQRSALGSSYSRISHDNFAMAQATDRRDIYPVLRTLFSRESQT